MQSKATTVKEYIEQLPEVRQKPIKKLSRTIKKNIPAGFKEIMNYGMIGYVVPHSIYPNGYHCNPKLPLPFMNIASQKNYIAIYHSGIYADPMLMKWLVTEYPKHTEAKMDMGKSCMRFKNIDQIPYSLIGDLASKMTTSEWINLYEMKIKK